MTDYDSSIMQTQAAESSLSLREEGSPSDAILTDRIEAALRRVSKRALQYEYQMKALEASALAKLTENLSNFRAVEGVLHERLNHIQRNSRRAEKAASSHIPTMTRELEESLDALQELKQSLPLVRSQVVDVRQAYDSGRDKARDLIHDLTWLNTDFYTRWRKIIFTPSVPVSARYKALMRTVFLITTSICLWLAWVSLRGIYRAHKKRLVWGERLIS